mgnify:CR=1 FL=1
MIFNIFLDNVKIKNRKNASQGKFTIFFIYTHMLNSSHIYIIPHFYIKPIGERQILWKNFNHKKAFYCAKCRIFHISDKNMKKQERYNEK